MSAATVTRGSLTVPSAGVVKQFQFNPPEIRDVHQINWGSLLVPGASHPIYQFGSGGERLISFDLYLDGDRYGYRQNKLFPPDTNITNDVNFYKGLSYPVGYGGSFKNVYPYIVLLSIGQLFPTPIPCLLRNGSDVKYTYFQNTMAPVRAVIPLSFAEVVVQSKTASQVWQGG